MGLDLQNKESRVHKAIKGLLFDKDGTLFDFQKSWGSWCALAIDDMAAEDPVIAARLANVLGFNHAGRVFYPESPVIAGTLDQLVDLVHSVFPARDRAELKDYMIDSATDVPMVPVVPLVPLLDGFRSRDLKIGLATNDAEIPARAHLEDANILSHFDFIAGFDSGFGGKPEPGMLLGFCEAMNLAPHQVAMIGDSTHDLFAGQAAGMVNIGVLTGTATSADLSPYSNVVLDHIGHIPAWLETG